MFNSAISRQRRLHLDEKKQTLKFSASLYFWFIIYASFIDSLPGNTTKLTYLEILLTLLPRDIKFVHSEIYISILSLPFLQAFTILCRPVRTLYWDRRAFKTDKFTLFRATVDLFNYYPVNIILGGLLRHRQLSVA